MRLKSLVNSVIFVASLFLLNSCSDDESPTLHFKAANGQIIEFKNAKVFLAREDDSNNHKYRDYFISDGELTEGQDGWALDQYQGATYFLAIELAVPAANDFAPGDFPQLNNWGDAGEDSNISYNYLQNEDESYYSSDSEDQSPVEVGGGFDNGDKMTLKFKGVLTYYSDYDGMNWTQQKEEMVEIYYSGKVVDKRGS